MNGAATIRDARDLTTVPHDVLHGATWRRLSADELYLCDHVRDHLEDVQPGQCRATWLKRNHDHTWTAHVCARHGTHSFTARGQAGRCVCWCQTRRRGRRDARLQAVPTDGQQTLG